MGSRSWLTEIKNDDNLRENYKKAYVAIGDNDDAYGISYALVMDKKLYFEEGSVVIAWSGDGSTSLNNVKEEESMKHTTSLEDVLGANKKWKEYASKKLGEIETNFDTSKIDIGSLDGFISHVQDLISASKK